MRLLFKDIWNVLDNSARLRPTAIALNYSLKIILNDITTGNAIELGLANVRPNYLGLDRRPRNVLLDPTHFCKEQNDSATCVSPFAVTPLRVPRPG